MSDLDGSPDESLPPPRRSSRLRTIALGIVLGSLAAIAGVISLLAILRGERLPAITFDLLDAAAARWAANGPADYDLDLELTGVNPGQAHIEVRHGEVTAMTLNGHPTRPHLWDNWSVPGLLAVIRRDLEVCMAPKPELGTASPVPRGEFDPRYGYPAQYHRVTPTGADAKWRVTRFAIL